MPLLDRLGRALALLVALAAFAACAWSAWSWQPDVWARQRLERATTLAAAKYDETARATLRELLRRLPRHREARWQLVQLEMQDRRFEQAYLEAKAYTELFPEATEAWLLIASLMNSGGLPDEAEAAADNAVASAPDKAEPRAMRASLRLRRGRFFGARLDAQLALAREPSNVALWAVLAQASAAVDGPPAGVEAVRKGLAATGGAPALQVALARTLAQSGDTARARAVAARALATPAKPAAQVLLARLEAREGHTDAAIAQLEAQLKDQPFNADAISARTLIQAASGHADAALQGLDAALPYAPALGNLREFVSRNRNQPALLQRAVADWAAAALAPPRAQPTPAARIHRGARRERGELVESHAMVWPGPLAELRRDSDRAVQAKDWPASAAVAARARKLFPGSVIGPWIEGVAALAQEHYTDAERDFDEALASAPRSALIVKGLAQAWVREGGAAAAGDKLMERVKLDPGFAFARRHAANRYLNGRRPDLAEAALRAALESPGDAGSYEDLATFYREMDRGSDALAICGQGLAKYPDNLDLEALAAQLTAPSDARAAIAKLEAVLSVAPDRTGDAIALADLLLADPASKPRALALLRQAELDAPVEFDDVSALGWALSRAGETARALPWLEAASQAGPDDLDLRYRLAATYVQAGRKGDALAHLEFALKSGKPFASQAEAQKLEQLIAARPR